jgi:hypothetical protein
VLRDDAICGIVTQTQSSGEPPMRASFVAAVAVLASIAPAFAAALTPNEIQATFFNGQAFTASATNIKYKMIFSADGKMSREPIGGGGSKGEGTWKLTKEGFCTTWKGSQPNCFRILTAGDNKWSVVKGTTVVATWTK